MKRHSVLTPNSLPWPENWHYQAPWEWEREKRPISFSIGLRVFLHLDRPSLGGNLAINCGLTWKESELKKRSKIESTRWVDKKRKNQASNRTAGMDGLLISAKPNNPAMPRIAKSYLKQFRVVSKGFSSLKFNFKGQLLIEKAESRDIFQRVTAIKVGIKTCVWPQRKALKRGRPYAIFDSRLSPERASNSLLLFGPIVSCVGELFVKPLALYYSYFIPIHLTTLNLLRGHWKERADTAGDLTQRKRNPKIPKNLVRSSAAHLSLQLPRSVGSDRIQRPDASPPTQTMNSAEYSQGTR